jgi:hypothetical protein
MIRLKEERHSGQRVADRDSSQAVQFSIVNPGTSAKSLSLVTME